MGLIVQAKEGTTIEDLTIELYNTKLNTDCIVSILLMVINNGDTWENSHEAEFPRSEAKDFLEDYFKETNYDKKFIKETLTKFK